MYYKYPRTYHLPWSPGRSSDDKVLKKIPFDDQEVVVTAKLDGENTTFYSDYIHARSLDYKPQPWRTFVKQIWGNISNDIPNGWRICGENLYAKHSIYYENLPAYFFVFSIWNEDNVCLSWEDTKVFSSCLNLETVPVLYEGVWNEKTVKAFSSHNPWGNEPEGYVVRLKDSFSYEAFKESCAKYVRADHIQTDKHWMNEIVTPNKLRK